jgi:hypothetical protein
MKFLRFPLYPALSTAATPFDQALLEQVAREDAKGQRTPREERHIGDICTDDFALSLRTLLLCALARKISLHLVN